MLECEYVILLQTVYQSNSTVFHLILRFLYSVFRSYLILAKYPYDKLHSLRFLLNLKNISASVKVIDKRVNARRHNKAT